ncbi:MAG: hypothetical protein AAGE52_11610 [Myxococcota bacterium]
MIVRFSWMLGLGVALGLGCGDDSRPATRDTGTNADAARDSGGGTDTGPGCTSDAECDDGHECTIDMCAVGGSCRHTALNERCADGEICSPERGCTSGCETAADCDNGMFCDGEEQCLGGMCAPARRAPDCADGNECTVDICDESVGAGGGCRYETAAGCDAGVVVGMDAGVPDPFDPDVHYEGTFRLSPQPSLGCSFAEYRFQDVMFSVEGGQLRVQAGRFNIAQNPTPTGESFNTTGTDATCTSVTLNGTFEHADRFVGQWSTTCGLCGTLTLDVSGRRR